jgi:hypothetical protein
LAQGASLHQYIGVGITFFNFPVISLSTFSQLSLSPNLYISLAISISLPISISLAIFSLPLAPHYTEKQNIYKGGEHLLRFAYSWGHRLKIVIYLTETEIH